MLLHNLTFFTYIDRYAVIHLHPLTSRVTDIEYKLQVSIDTLVNRVKVAALADPPLGTKLCTFTYL